MNENLNLKQQFNWLEECLKLRSKKKQEEARRSMERAKLNFHLK